MSEKKYKTKLNINYLMKRKYNMTYNHLSYKIIFEVIMDSKQIYDYILKICARDVESLEAKLLLLKKQKGVVKSHTMLALMEHKLSAAALPDLE